MPFEYRHQPIKSAYLVYALLSTILVRLPYWLVISILPSWRARPTWSIGREIFVRGFRVFLATMYKTGLPSSEAPESVGTYAHALGLVWIEPARDSLVVGEVKDFAKLNGVEAKHIAGYWYGARDNNGKVGQEAGLNERVVYHIHGGGFVMNSAGPKDVMTPVIISGLLSHCSSISRVFCIEYRLSTAAPFPPSNPFPAALLDALAGYDYLLRTLHFTPQNIILSGDSAGASIALSLLRYLLSPFPSAPLLSPPAGMLLISPAGEWANTHTMDGKHASFVRNSVSDYGQPFYAGYPARAILGKMAPEDVYTNPWISPSSRRISDTSGLFRNFPKTCIVAGECEMQLDAIHTLRDRIVADIGEEKVRYVEKFGATHIFLGLKIHEPERTEALQEVGEWINGLFSKPEI